MRRPAKKTSQLIANVKMQLTPAKLEAADRSRRRVVFNQTCAKCHRLFGVGGSIGPDLTGPNHPEVFVIGDLALARDAKGEPLPGMAPVAMQPR